jgi:hypothetical protein
MRFLASDFFHELTPHGFLIHTLNLGYCELKLNSKIFESMTQGVHIGLIHKKNRNQESHATVPLTFSQYPPRVKICRK